MKNDHSKRRFLIVGGVAGGATAAARLRRLTEEAEIILFEKGEHISYANCGLPYYIGGVIADRNRLFVQTPAAFAQRFNIDVRTNSEVTAIDRANKTVSVRTANGETYTERYDKLLLAPGASPVRPPLKGIEDERVFTLRNVADTDRIKQTLSSGKIRRAVIVGAGFIGLEMAENLVHAGVKEVTVIEMAPQVMAPIDYSMAAIVHEHLLQHHVRLCLGEAVSAFERQENGELTVCLKSGAQISTDMVLLSIGVRAESRLAAEAGLEVGETRCIKVNRYLQTSDKDIYAVGDAIEYPHPLTGKPWGNLLAGPANRQARIVADNMVADAPATEYEGAIGTAIAKVFDITVASTGLPAKRLKQLDIPYLSATIHSSSHAGYYPGATQMTLKITFSPSDGRLFGAQIVGYDGVDARINQYALAIKEGANVEQLTRIEHAYAPPFSSAKDPVAISGYVATNILSGKMSPLYWRELKDADLGKIALIDVRTPEEYALGSLPGAKNIPLDEMRGRLAEIPTDKPIWLFCGVGLRGYLASNILKGNGFEEVRNLVGGLKTYRAATAEIPRFDAPKQECTAPISACSCTPKQERAHETLTLDACGIQCPGPIRLLKQKMDELSPGAHLEVKATDGAFPRDAEAWCRTTGNKFIRHRMEQGFYIVEIEKAAAASAPVAVQPAGDKGKTFILFSDDLDKVLATFVLANGAAATGKKVSIFFTFWGLNAIKKNHKPLVKKDIWGKMFGWMLPSDSSQLSLSKMNMLGIGAKMMRFLMDKKGVDSLETLRQQAIDAGVEFIACQMSMDVMGIKREELLDNVSIGGVATYMERAEASNVNLFI